MISSGAFNFAPLPVTHTPHEYVISPEVAECSLLAFKNESAMDLMKYPKLVLENFSPIFVRFVCSNFDCSTSQGYVPMLWKCANVFPLPKFLQPCFIDTYLYWPLTKTVLSCITDFSKDFNKIDHYILISKIRLLLQSY